MGGEIGEGASSSEGWPAPLWVPGLLAALRGKSSSKADGVVLLVAVLGVGSSGTAQPPRGSAAAGLQLGTVRAALRVRGLPRLQHHGPVPEEDEETLEGVDDGENVEGDKAEHTRGEGEEDQCPGDAQQDAQPKEGQDMLELVTFFVLPEDLPDHGPQHDRVKEEHQAEETQVHDVMDQGVRDPAYGCVDGSAINGFIDGNGEGAVVRPASQEDQHHTAEGESWVERAE